MEKKEKEKIIKEATEEIVLETKIAINEVLSDIQSEVEKIDDEIYFEAGVKAKGLLPKKQVLEIITKHKSK